MTKKPGTLNKTPLSDAEVGEALEASGYPLEVQLFQELRHAGLHPSLGSRVRVTPEGQTKEIDLVAWQIEYVVLPEFEATVTLEMCIAVKRLHDPDRFVGVLGICPEERARCAVRVERVGGIPSHGYLPEVLHGGLLQVLTGVRGLAPAMLPISNAPWCVHWAIAHRRPEGPWASGQKPFWDDFDTIVRASYAKGLNSAQFGLERARLTAKPTPELLLSLPILVVDAPDLVVYDPQSKVVTRTDWLTLHQTFEVWTGEAIGCAIDVVTRTGLRAYISQVKSAASALASGVSEHLEDLTKFAIEQRASSKRSPSSSRTGGA